MNTKDQHQFQDSKRMIPYTRRWIFNARRLEIMAFALLSIICSSDLAFNVQVGGFSLRLGYILILFLFCISVLKSKHGRFWFFGSISMSIWSLLNLIFVFNTPLLSRNIGYFFWHVFHLMLLAWTANRIDKTLISPQRIIRLYVAGYVAMALFGYLQMGAGIAGVDLFVRQWWPGRIPRINGLSYEPSYYALYMITGFVTLHQCISRKVLIFGGRWRDIVAALIIGGSIVLSSSRSGLAVVIVYLTGTVIFSNLDSLQRMRLRLSSLMALTVILASVAAVGYFAVSNIDKVKFLLQGTGIGGTASHSVNDRSKAMRETWGVFADSPLIGVSFGGIPAAIAEKQGIQISTPEAAKNFEGVNVFFEALAASGIFGFSMLIWYLFSLIFHGLKTTADDDFEKTIKSLSVGLMTSLILLMESPTILRLYLWLHISILSGFILHRRRIRHLRNTGSSGPVELIVAA